MVNYFCDDTILDGWRNEMLWISSRGFNFDDIKGKMDDI
jgi:hypothetical protein